MEGDERWSPKPTNPGSSKILGYAQCSSFVDAEGADLGTMVEAVPEGGWVFWIGFDTGVSTPPSLRGRVRRSSAI